MTYMFLLAAAISFLAAGVWIGKSMRPAAVLRPRVVYGVTDAMVEAMAKAVLRDMWTGPAGTIGLTTDRSDWFRRFKWGMEGAMTYGSAAINPDHPLLRPICDVRFKAATTYTPEFAGQRFEDYDRGVLASYHAVETALRQFEEKA